MNPKEFSWTEDQQVTVTNPTDKDFTWQVHGKSYQLGAGKTAKMPGFIAWLYVYNQSIMAAQKDGEFTRWNEEGFRNKYYEKFFVGADELIQVVESEPEPEVHTFGDDLEPGTGANYDPEPKAKRGRPART